MPNGPNQAAYWRDFVIARCGFPNSVRLAQQFEGAEFSDFCDCGCSSFAVRVSDAVLASREPFHLSASKRLIA